MPRLQQFSTVIQHDALDLSKLVGTKPQVTSQEYWLEPELGGEVVSIDVNVWWLVHVVTDEIEPKRAVSEDCRHPNGS
jgi:hypothetical protein